MEYNIYGMSGQSSDVESNFSEGIRLPLFPYIEERIEEI